MAKQPRPDELRAAIRARGLRATPSRLAVLGLLQVAAAPLSHGEVAARLAARPWDRATIFRNLVDLTGAGLVHRRDVGDHVWRFAVVTAAQDPRHPQFVCVACGAVERLPDVELSIRRGRAPRAVRQRRVEIQVRGRCDACG